MKNGKIIVLSAQLIILPGILFMAGCNVFCDKSSEDPVCEAYMNNRELERETKECRRNVIFFFFSGIKDCSALAGTEYDACVQDNTDNMNFQIMQYGMCPNVM